MADRLIEKQKTLFILKIDYRKAFEKVKHIALSKLHAEYNIATNFQGKIYFSKHILVLCFMAT